MRSLVQRGSLEGERGAYRLTGAAGEIAIPATVQAVLAARIDRLAEPEKDLLQCAAVIGKRFSAPLLRLVTGAVGRPAVSDAELASSLEALQRAGFVFSESLYPVVEMAFAHPLTQEVAYDSQLGERRMHVHAAVARAIAALHPDKLEERAALLAHHWERAGAAWEAALWSRRAASWASGSDARESLRHLHRVLALLQKVEESPPAIALALETCTAILRVSPFVDLSVGEAERILARGRELAARGGDRRALAELISTYGYFQMMRGRVVEARRYNEEATRVAQGVEDEALDLSLTLDEAQSSLWAGRLREALRAAELALQYFRRGRPLQRGINVGLGGEPFANALRGLCLAFMGRCREAAQLLDETVEAAREEGREALCVAHAFRAMVGLVSEDGTAAGAHGRAAAGLAAQMDNPFLSAVARMNVGMADLLDGRLAEAGRVLEELLEEPGDSASALLFRGIVLSGLAYADLGRDDGARALARAEEALRVDREHGQRLMECFSQIVLARVALSVAGIEARSRLEGAIERVCELIEETGASSFTPRVHELRAELAAALGDGAEQRRQLDEAHHLYAACGMDAAAAAVERRLRQVS